MSPVFFEDYRLGPLRSCIGRSSDDGQTCFAFLFHHSRFGDESSAEHRSIVYRHINIDYSIR
jgi:hypothetical protein